MFDSREGQQGHWRFLLRCWREKHKSSPEIVQEIDRLLDDHTYDEIATILNDRGLLTRVGNPYGPVRIMKIEKRYGLKSRYDRLREAGHLTDEEMAKLLGVSPKTVAERRKRGLLKAARVNDRPEYLYERPIVSVNGSNVRRFAKD